MFHWTIYALRVAQMVQVHRQECYSI